MASLVEQILLSINATVTGAAGVSQLTGSIGGLTTKLVGLNAGMQVVGQVTAGVNQLVSQMGEYARKADGAAVAARSWQIVLERFNVDAGKAETSMQMLSDKTGATTESLKGAAAQYIKMGGTLEDFEKGALAAASSWYDLSVKSISLEDSISNVTLGLAQGRSELMETSGIVVNASQAWKKYADANNTTVDAMDDATKAHAYALAVYKEEQIGIETLADKQTALSKAETQATNSKKELGKAIGTLILPAYTQMITGSTQVTRGITEMLMAYAKGEDGLAKLTQAFPALSKVMGQIGPEGGRMKQAITGAWDAIRSTYDTVLVPIFERLEPLAKRVMAEVPRFVTAAANAIRENFLLIQSLWNNVLKPVWDAIAPIVGAALGQVINLLGGLLTFIAGISTSIRKLLDGDWKGAWEAARDAVGNALLKIQDALEELAPKLWKVITEIATSAYSKAQVIGLNLKDGLIAGMSGLAADLATMMDNAIDKMTANIPDWVKDRLGMSAADRARAQRIDDLNDTSTAAQSRIIGRTQPQQGPQQGGAAYDADSSSGVYQSAVALQSIRNTGVRTADMVVDYCAQWVRLTLGRADARIAPVINKLFQTDSNKDGVTEARDAAANIKAAGLMRNYSGKVQDLRPGDTVFYTENGQNHVGIYVGGGMVRGNNRVTYQQNGGKFDSDGRPISSGINPVGNVAINSLGKVSGYARADDLAAYAQLPSAAPVNTPAAKNKPPTTPTPDAPVAPSAESVRKSVEAQIKDILARVDLKLIGKDAAVKLLAQIDAEATRIARKQGTGWQEYAATAKSAESAIEGLKKGNTSAKETKDLLGALSTQYEYAGKTGLPAYIKSLNAFIAVQDKAAKSAKAGSKEQLEAQANVNRARQMLADTTGKKDKPEITVSQADLNKYSAAALQIAKLEAAIPNSTDTAWVARAQARISAYNAQGEAAQKVLGIVSGTYAQQKALDNKAAEDLKQVRADQEAAAKTLTSLDRDQLQQRVAGREAAEKKIASLRDAALKAAGTDAQARLSIEQSAAAALKQQAKNTAEAQLILAKRTAEDAYKATLEGIPEKASAAQVKAITDAAGKVRSGSISGAYRTYYSEIGKAAEEGRDRVSAAQLALTNSLQAGVDAGNAALASLDTSKLSGQELAGAAQVLIPAQKTFDALYIRLLAMRQELSTPGVADAWGESITELGKRGRLSAEQVGILKAIITDLNTAAQTLKLDNLDGRGVQNEAGPLDPSKGVLGAGEPEKLLTAMLGLSPQELGGILAGLVAKGFGESDLAKLIRGALADDANAIDEALRDFGSVSIDVDTGKLTFQTEEQLRGIGVAAEDAREDFFDLGNAAQTAIQLTWEELNTLLTATDLLPEQIEAITKAWRDFNGPDLTTTGAFLGGLIDELQVAQDAFDSGGTGLDDTLAKFEALRAKAASIDDDGARGLVAYIDQFTTSWKELRQETQGMAADGSAIGTLITQLEEAQDAFYGGGASIEDTRVKLTGLREQLALIGGPVATALIGAVDEMSAGFDRAAVSAAEFMAALDKPGVIERAAEQAVSGLDELIDGYQAGSVTATQFAAASLPAAKELERLAKAAEKNNQPELAASLRLTAEALRSMTPAAAKVAEKLGKFAEYAGYVQQLSGAFSGLASAVGKNDLAANLDGIGNFASKAIAIVGDIASGNWVGAITKVVAGIADAIAGFQRARAEAKKLAEDFNKQFSLIDATTFSTFTTRSRGFFADLFGGGPEVVKQINETAATIAKAIETGVLGGFTNGIKAFLNGTGTMLDAIREGVRGAIIDAITQAVIQGAIIKGALGSLLTELTNGLAAGTDVTGVIAQIGAALPGIARSLEQTLAPLKSAVDKALPPSTSSSSANTSGSSFGSGSATFQAGTPAVVIDVLSQTRDLLKGANEVGRLQIEAARQMGGHVDRFGDYVTQLHGPHNSATAGAR